jgi:hypothetical protein
VGEFAALGAGLNSLADTLEVVSAAEQYAGALPDLEECKAHHSVGSCLAVVTDAVAIISGARTETWAGKAVATNFGILYGGATTAQAILGDHQKSGE